MKTGRLIGGKGGKSERLEIAKKWKPPAEERGGGRFKSKSHQGGTLCKKGGMMREVCGDSAP